MSCTSPHSRKVAASSRFFSSSVHRGRTIACTTRNDSPTASNGTAERTAAERPRATPMLASRTSKPILEATAKPTSAIASQRSILFIWTVTTSVRFARERPFRNLHEPALDLQGYTNGRNRLYRRSLESGLSGDRRQWHRCAPQEL